MKKILKKFVRILFSSWSHLIIGALFMIFAWCMAYEIGYNIDENSLIIGAVGCAGFTCFDCGLQMLLDRKKDMEDHSCDCR